MSGAKLLSSTSAGGGQVQALHRHLHRRNGGGSAGGSPSGSQVSPHSASSGTEDVDPYKLEKKLMRVKGYDSIKIVAIPKNAAECRGFTNQVVAAICKTCKGDETPLVAWSQRCSSVEDPAEFAFVGNYPVLDRT